METNVQIITDLYEIILASKLFKYVSLTEDKAIKSDVNLPSCYIIVHGENYKLNGITTADGKGYDREMIVSLNINMQCINPLDFLDLQNKVVRAILNDTPLWTVVLDRDIEVTEWDDNSYYPKKEGKIVVSLKYRSC